MLSALFLASQLHILTLAEAVQSAAAHQPQLRQASAQVDAARARAESARASLLPQVNGSATFQRSTANFAPRPGALPSAINATQAGASFDTFNYFNFGLTAQQALVDVAALGRARAAGASVEAESATAQATALAVEAQAAHAFFSARARKELVAVAREALENQERHLKQIEAFVRAGSRPEIDVVQARAERASARLALVRAENDYAVARAQLDMAMGRPSGAEYDVGDETLGPVEGEETAAAPAELDARPDLIAAERRIHAQGRTVWAAKAGWAPTLSLSTSLTEAGTNIERMALNWSAGVQLNVPIFDGLRTRAAVREAEANQRALEAQRDQSTLQAGLEVEQARRSIRAGRASVGAAEEALENARERLRMAEGRYQAGVGSVIELSDARTALATAGGQRVQAEYDLAAARAGLVRALGHHLL